ncbi:MAG: hypothetical protein EBU75_10560, partial [Betaproteobacteria bacterium]|nr:hypothetical protein [Betaproteobacteria bacterium]
MNLSDSDNAELASLRISLPVAQIAAGDQLRYNSTVIELTNVTQTGEVTVGSRRFSYSAADAKLSGVDTRTFSFTSLESSGGVAQVALISEFESLLDGLKFNNSADALANGTRTLSLVVNDGISNSAVATQTITVQATNEVPTVTDEPYVIRLVPLSAATGGYRDVVLDRSAVMSNVDGVALSQSGTSITDPEAGTGAKIARMQ